MSKADKISQGIETVAVLGGIAAVALYFIGKRKKEKSQGASGIGAARKPTFIDFVNILDRCGWAYYSWQDTYVIIDGKKKQAVRFGIEKYPQNLEYNTPFDVNLVKQEIKRIFGDRAIFQTGYPQFAPEIKKTFVTLIGRY